MAAEIQLNFTVEQRPVGDLLMRMPGIFCNRYRVAGEHGYRGLIRFLIAIYLTTHIYKCGKKELFDA